MNEKYVKGKKASEIIGVHQRTLYLWEKKGLIETIRTTGNTRLYNVEKYTKKKEVIKENIEKNVSNNNFDKLVKSKNKLNICYIRISSDSQKDNLEKQRESMVMLYPKHVIIEDIGSNLNLNKTGIKKIIMLAAKGKINELVITNREKLAKFEFELIEDLIKECSKGKITVLENKNQIESEEDLMKDIMSIMNIHMSKMNGLRKYNK